MKNKNDIEKAKEFYKQAQEEYEKAKETKDDVLFRDAGEKGWNAIVLATNFLIERIIGVKSKRNIDRRNKLFEIQKQNGKITRYKFYERFMARCHFLHEECFYDGTYTDEQILWNLRKVSQYIKDVEKVVK